jgi:hypothetical protein
MNVMRSKITVRTPITYRKPFSKLKNLDQFGAIVARADRVRDNSAIGENNTANKQLLTRLDCHHTHTG